MIRKILKYGATAIACFVVLVLSSALSYRAYLQHEVSQERAIRSPNGINSLARVRTGGIDQWIEVRGQSVNNPILLFIHGGPGLAFIPMAGAFQSPWEKYFTVVQWDQRGAGKTYASNDKEQQRRTLNVPQMEQDTLDVVNYLRNRFHKKKIFVVGHSWGSILGLWLAHEHPETIYAYVGVGQVVNVEQNQEIAYQDALQEARARRNEQAIKDLEGIAPYPPPDGDLGKGQIANNWQAKLLGPPNNGVEFVDGKRLVKSLVSAPEYSIGDDLAFVRGQLFSLETLTSEMSKVDLGRLNLDFQVPIFFFEGRHDPYCRPSLIQQYSDTIRAPRKDFVWFENSGHFPFFEEKQKFADELFQRVLPIAVDRWDST